LSLDIIKFITHADLLKLGGHLLNDPVLLLDLALHGPDQKRVLLYPLLNICLVRISILFVLFHLILLFLVFLDGFEVAVIGLP
jgi:hypothetical protein